MPKRLPRISDDDDDRPAFGLRDDDYDDHLRKHALSDEERDDISAAGATSMWINTCKSVQPVSIAPLNYETH
jgi:hypothetical protein